MMTKVGDKALGSHNWPDVVHNWARCRRCRYEENHYRKYLTLLWPTPRFLYRFESHKVGRNIRRARSRADPRCWQEHICWHMHIDTFCYSFSRFVS